MSPPPSPLHSGTPGLFVSPGNLDLLRSADAVLSLDWVDLGGTLRQAHRGGEPAAAVVSASADHTLFNGWTKNDHFLPPVDVSLQCRPDVAVAALLDRLPPRRRGAAAGISEPPARVGSAEPAAGSLTVGQLAATLRRSVSDGPATLIRVPLSWDASCWPVSAPLDYLGSDGGGGIGSGPGMAVGAALALQGSARLPVAVLGDGDYLMGLTALWTAARYELPLLVVVANNGSFFNDELHQDRVARLRDRPVANAHIGMRVQGPDPDLAALARGQGLEGLGPVTQLEELPCALQRAVRLVRDGHPTVVDVRVERGYGATTAAAITRQASG
jgi:thiamine pyrophosphate-dependent acetolactate synthase large subunit-like protein